MKKYFSLLLIALFGLVAVSCDTRNDDPYQDYDTYSVVYDITNVNFINDPTYGWSTSHTFKKPFYNTDVLLVYRKSGSTGNGSPVWQQIPRTLYISATQELDYDFDFTANDVMIYAGGNYDISTTPSYLNNQTFRIVQVPASAGKNANVDFSDYNSVIKHFNIDDSKTVELK
ncbi:hypothetical protein P0M11_05735 [Kaistella sp. PBT33-4]|uniref:hypothetical protein n=1 Tax=Kaistella sp. PBT33-4 TaxID=3032000 RepID=UPI0023D82146|nr:hypothetical protein [Kaistella sp. PBT33-4]MDF0719498.1 hypothetical protein [Kaistella sp. PBT33-4]